MRFSKPPKGMLSMKEWGQNVVWVAGIIVGVLGFVWGAATAVAGFQTEDEVKARLAPVAVVLSLPVIWRGWRRRYRPGLALGIAGLSLALFGGALFVRSLDTMFDNICTTFPADGGPATAC